MNIIETTVEYNYRRLAIPLSSFPPLPTSSYNHVFAPKTFTFTQHFCLFLLDYFYFSFIHTAACLLNVCILGFFVLFLLFLYARDRQRESAHTVHTSIQYLYYLIIMNVIVSNFSSLLFSLFNLASLRIIFCAFRCDECAIMRVRLCTHFFLLLLLLSFDVYCSYHFCRLKMIRN